MQIFFYPLNQQKYCLEIKKVSDYSS